MIVRAIEKSALGSERHAFALGGHVVNVAAFGVRVGGKIRGYMYSCIKSRPGGLNWLDYGLLSSLIGVAVVLPIMRKYVAFNALIWADLGGCTLLVWLWSF